MLTLDEEDELAYRPIGVVEPQPRKRAWGKIALVLALGGVLGTGGYFLPQLSTSDVLEVLDISDRPHLRFSMPGLASAPAPAGETQLGEIKSIAPSEEMLALLRPPSTDDSASKGLTAPKAEPKATPLVPAATVPNLPSLPKSQNDYAAPTYASLLDRADPKQALAEAPIDDLTVKGPHGLLPKIASDGTQPWKAYSRPFSDPMGKPKMAVMVTGLGLDVNGTDAAITKLPPEVSLVFSPYAGGLDKWIKKARAFGHEVWVALPVEGAGYPARDPGPLGLLIKNTPEENLTRLFKVLARSGGAVGVYVEDGTFARSPQMAQIAATLKSHGMAMVGPAIKGTDAPASARITQTLPADIFRESLDARLTNIARTTLETGNQVLSLTARPLIFARVSPWLDRLYHDGVAIAPVSALVK